MIETNTFIPLDILLDQFSKDTESAAVKPEATYTAVAGINPDFTYQHYSDLPQADLLANIVAGIYAPVIHGFTSTVVSNIATGNLPNHVLLPPRDTIPIMYSLQQQANIQGVDITIYTPAINRITAGIANNQASYNPAQDQLFDKLLLQHFGQLNGPLLELETGIYGTTTLALAEGLQRNGINESVIPFKLYGLGPNLSFIHGLLSGGETWSADRASAELSEQVLDAMVFVDSIEEFGMQNRYKSVPGLYQDSDGYALPVIQEYDHDTREIAAVTNLAVANTAAQYGGQHGVAAATNIFAAIPQMLAVAKAGIPICLQGAVPPMDNKDKHFAALSAAREQGLILHPHLNF